MCGLLIPMCQSVGLGSGGRVDAPGRCAYSELFESRRPVLRDGETKQRLPFRIISKLPRKTLGHSLAMEAKAWAWQACPAVLDFSSA